jgi:uroporphyrinogen-III synthase
MNALRGRTILVTRASEDAREWVEEIVALGGTARLLPCLCTEMISDETTRSTLRRALADGDWLALTSKHGVEATAALLGRPLPASLAVACVGPATAAAAHETLGRVDLVARGPGGRELAEELLGRLEAAGDPREAVVVWVTADRGRAEFAALLRERGVDVRRITGYRTRVAGARRPRLDLDDEGVDAILLASPSAVEGLLNQVRVPTAAAIVTIGPTTSAAARAAGLAVSAEADRPQLDRMLELCTEVIS